MSELLGQMFIFMGWFFLGATIALRILLTLAGRNSGDSSERVLKAIITLVGFCVAGLLFWFGIAL